LVRDISSALPCNLVLSGTGLEIKFAFETLASSVGVSGLAPVLMGITTYLEQEPVRAALLSSGVAVDMPGLARFAGRPRFAMRLCEGLMMGQSAATVAASLCLAPTVGLKDKLLRLKAVALSNEPGAELSSDTVYGELRMAAKRWILKAQATRLRGGAVALEAGVCALELSKELFTVREPLVLESLAEDPTLEFRNLELLPASEIGLRFEEFLGWNAAALCELLSSEELGVVLEPEFEGPWELRRSEVYSMRRGVEVSKDGDEPTWIRRILEEEWRTTGGGPYMVWPGTRMGADIVVVARNPRTGRWLLLFVQCKATPDYSTPEAMRSLRWPYHINRQSAARSVPPNLTQAAAELNGLLARPDVSVALLVVKYPADSASGYPRVKHAERAMQAGGARKRVLELVVDRSNAAARLKGLYAAMKDMEKVKSLRADVFLDDDSDGEVE